MQAREGLVCMVGTDHALASADVRSAFALSPDARDAALPVARAALGATGVALLATCNRTELWASFDGVEPPERSLEADGTPRVDDPLLAALCALHNVDPASYAQYFCCREGERAVNHLFQVACGLRSAIVAEDQIISQVKGAIANARELGVADSCLEVLFRQAVTAAKQVKSSVRFTRAYATAVDQAIVALAQRGVDLANATCLVIGNGEYGRLAASRLAAQGARVLVTVRQYTHGTVVVPHGCEGVPYADRYAHLGSCDVVMSATTSPHFTLECDRLAYALAAAADASGNAAAEAPGNAARTRYFFDLAIPNDIDPAIGSLDGCERFDIDAFTTQVGTENTRALAEAQRLLDAGEAEFWDWVSRRESFTRDHPPAHAFFPLFVDLSDKRAVFVGGGAIALRRVRTLLPFADDITVFAPDFSPELERFAADGAVELVRRPFAPDVLDGADIVFACTNDSGVNEQVWELCKERGILVNVCSDRFKCDFHFPGIAQEGNVTIGVNAGGKSHRLVKQLRARIARLLVEEDW